MEGAFLNSGASVDKVSNPQLSFRKLKSMNFFEMIMHCLGNQSM
jgi:hypothetical protein